jgi:hypothetical protein
LKIDRKSETGAARNRGAEGQRLAALERDAAIKDQIEKDRAKSAAKTARLRALRLAKEAADKSDTDKQSVPEIAKAPVKRRLRIFG